MKPYNIKSYLAISAMALVISACSDSTYEGDADVVTEVTRLRLSAGGGVTVTPVTRSTNLDFQNGTFAEGTEIGLFMMQGVTFENHLDSADAAMTPADGGTSATRAAVRRLTEGGNAELAAMVDAAYPDGEHYGYENIRAYIDADGSIRRADGGPDFIYPLHATDRVAIVAYAPYDETVTYDDLVGGTPVAVVADQNTDQSMLWSDFLVGIPEPGNPFRGAEGEPVGIDFRHAMSSLQLHTTITNVPEFRSDSVIITMKDVALADTIQLAASARSLQQGDGATFFGSYAPTAEADTMEFRTRGDVVLARMAGLGSRGNGDKVTLSCNAIVVPQTFAEGLHPTFEITLKGRGEGVADTTIVRTDMNDGVIFRSGKMKIYRTSIPIGDDDTPDETLPDEGKDDVILGSPGKK